MSITIDNVEYSEDDLSNEAKEELGSMQSCDQRIAALQMDLAITQTARNAYAFVLRGMLTEAGPKVKAKAKAKAKAKKV